LTENNDKPECVEIVFEVAIKCEPELEINDIGLGMVDDQNFMEYIGNESESDINDYDQYDGNIYCTQLNESLYSLCFSYVLLCYKVGFMILFRAF
jgi:hypothetical protein